MTQTSTPSHEPADEQRRHCIDCGYRVDNLASNRCPECGRAFDPAELLSTTRDGPLGYFGRRAVARRDRLLKPARSIVPLAVVVALAVCGWSVVAVLPRSVFALVLVAAYALILLIHFPRYAGHVSLITRHGLDRAILAVDARPERQARAVLGAAAVLLLLRVPFWAVFLISLPALNRSAHHEYNVRPANDPRPTGITVGIVPVRAVTCDGLGVNYALPGNGALMFRPDDHEPSPTHLVGPWYLTE